MRSSENTKVYSEKEIIMHPNHFKGIVIGCVC